jgi:hypothetical protein
MVMITVAVDPDTDPGTAVRAQKLAAGILHRSGIEVAWTPDPCGSMGCGAPDRAMFVVAVHILKQPIPGTELSDDALGIALIRAGPSHVAVFFDRVARTAQATESPVAIVLGSAMAHEIAHALLGSGAHSERGLMQHGFSRLDFWSAARGQLLLKPEEAEAIRRRLRP